MRETKYTISLRCLTDKTAVGFTWAPLKGSNIWTNFMSTVGITSQLVHQLYIVTIHVLIRSHDSWGLLAKLESQRQHFRQRRIILETSFSRV